MRELPAGIQSRVGNSHYRATELIELSAPVGGGNVYRWTTWPVPLTYEGNVYTPMPVTPSDIVSDATMTTHAELRFADVDQTIRAIVWNEGTHDRRVTVLEAWINESDDTVVGAFAPIIGKCGRVSLDERSATLTIQVIGLTSHGTMGPKENFAINCRYRDFKGARCKYAGAELECNRTWTRCTELANTANFGGFPYAPRPSEVVYFGGVPKKLEERRRG